MSSPPSLGSAPKEVLKAWKRLESRPASSQHVVTGFIPLVGHFTWRHGRLYRSRQMGDHKGIATILRTATREDKRDIAHAINNGTLQVEARTAAGAMGYGDGGHLVKIYHQATGRRPTCTSRKSSANTAET